MTKNRIPIYLNFDIDKLVGYVEFLPGTTFTAEDILSPELSVGQYAEHPITLNSLSIIKGRDYPKDLIDKYGKTLGKYKMENTIVEAKE